MTCRGLSWEDRSLGGLASKTAAALPFISGTQAGRSQAIRYCCTLRQVPLQNRKWFCTLTKAIRSVTFRRSFFWVFDQAIATGTSALQVGQSTHGVVSLRRGMLKRQSLFTIFQDSTRSSFFRRLQHTTSRPCVRRRPYGG